MIQCQTNPKIRFIIPRLGLILIALLTALLPLNASDTRRSAQPAPIGAQADRPDRQFVTDAAMFGLVAIERGKLAVKRGEAAAVRTVAERVVSDHTHANDELKLIAAMNNVPWPVVLDGNHQSELAALAALSGPPFDHAFLQQIVDGHQAAAASFRGEVESGRDPAVKKWAEQTLPTIEEHLKMAQAASKPSDN